MKGIEKQWRNADKLKREHRMKYTFTMSEEEREYYRKRNNSLLFPIK